MNDFQLDGHGVEEKDYSGGFDMGFELAKDATENEQFKQGFHFEKDKVKLAAEEIKSRFRKDGFAGALDDNYYKGIGTAIEPGWNLDRKLKEAGLDWEVETAGFDYQSEKTGRKFTSVKDQIVFRSDNGERFCMTPDTWQPFQNREVVNVFDDFCNQAGIQMERLGELRGGRLIFASAVINESWEVMNSDDIILGRLILTNSHVYGTGLTAKLSAVRLVCCNGITRKVSVGQRSLGHNMAFSKEKVNAILESSKNNFANLGMLLDKLAQVKIDNREAKAFLIETLGDKEEGRLKDFLDQNPLVRQSYYNFQNHTSTGAHFETSHNTAYELLQCVTEHINHNMRSKGEQHIHSMWHGDKADIETKVLNSMEWYFLNQKQKQKKAQTVGVRAF